ncbi:MAG TPA: argininosuccinate lyase [Thermomicrobiales bacterium]|nr:argininosuccinate lyase [Thermomicrobiales bacterium]
MSNPPAPFPNPIYAREILEVGFREAQRLLFTHMQAANEAHILMLVEQGIVSRADGAALFRAFAEVEQAGPSSFDYEPKVEDLFFAVEGRVIAETGVDVGGNLQIARSRNDLAAAMSRMFIRERSLGVQRAILAFRAGLIELAAQHVRTIMPGITHTQPAQPTTLAHYLLGVLGPLERDSARLRQGWARLNHSPLGVAAFTTTSFPIDRDKTARYLGFDGLVVNGYDAVGAGDHMLEATQSLVTMVSGISRFVYELLVWTRREVGVLRIADEFIQISSIMPQKRNPVVLEHVRARLAYVYGDSATVGTMIHSAAFGDTNDVEDQILLPIGRAFDAAVSVLELLGATLKTATFDVDLLAARAGEGNTTATAVADGLVRDFGLSFRAAHSVLSRLVSEGGEITGERLSQVATEIAGRPIEVDETWAARTLDPWAFVHARALPGGPAPEETSRAIAAAREQLAADTAWLHETEAKLDAAATERKTRIAEIVGDQEI